MHNHLLRNQPVTMYMHVMGHGDPVKLAAVFHAMLVESKTPICGAHDGPSPAPPPLDLDTAAIDRRSAPRAPMTAGCTFAIARAEPIKADGIDVPPPMGSANAINFQPTGGGKAAITGDFVVIANEVQPVIKALRRPRDRGHRDPQPHARRRAAAVLHAFLGE